MEVLDTERLTNYDSDEGSTVSGGTEGAVWTNWEWTVWSAGTDHSTNGIPNSFICVVRIIVVISSKLDTITVIPNALKKEADHISWLDLNPLTCWHCPSD